MAKVTALPRVEVKVTLELNADEAKALWALACYGADSFLKTFYEKMGKAYLGPHEKGLRSLFNSVGSLDEFIALEREAQALLNGSRTTTQFIRDHERIR